MLVPELVEKVQDCCEYRTYTKMRRTCKWLYSRAYHEIYYSYVQIFFNGNRALSAATSIIIEDKLDNSRIKLWTQSQYIRYITAYNIRAKTGNLIVNNIGCDSVTTNFGITLSIDNNVYYYTLMTTLCEQDYIKIGDQYCFGTISSIIILAQYLYYYIPELYHIICMTTDAEYDRLSRGIIIYSSDGPAYHKFFSKNHIKNIIISNKLTATAGETEKKLINNL